MCYIILTTLQVTLVIKNASGTVLVDTQGQPLQVATATGYGASNRFWHALGWVLAYLSLLFFHYTQDQEDLYIYVSIIYI